MDEMNCFLFFFSSRRRHTRWTGDWSSDVCSSDLGCITATGNVNVTGIRKVYENWRTPQADQLQAEITNLRKTIQAYPMVPALKRIVAHFHHDPAWAAVRPPMVALNEAQSAALIGDLTRLGFTLGERRRESTARA